MLLGAFWLLATNVAALAIPRLVNMAIDDVEGRGTHWPLSDVAATFEGIVAVIAVLTIVGAIVRTLSRVVLFSAGRDVEQDLRRSLFAHLGTLSSTFYGKSSVGDVMSRLTNDLTNIRLLSGFALLSALNALIIVVATLPLLVSIDAKVGLLALSPFPLVIILSQVVSKRMFHRTRENQEAIGKLSTTVQESLAGQMVIRALSQEDAVIDRFAAQNGRVFEASMRLARIRILMGPLMGLMGSLSVGIALYVGGAAVIDGRISIGDVVEINTRIMQLTWPMIAVGFTLSVWQRGKASLTRINELFDARPDIVDGQHARDGKRLRGAVDIKGMSLRLGNPARTVVDDVTLHIAPGSFQGIVGRNGSGKSLLLKAMARQLDPGEGEVLIDDVPIPSWQLQALRQAPGGIGVVPEDGFLFSASIKENLAFGAGPDVDDAAINAVVDLVDLRRDIDRLPEGLETMVGERGVTLSGGQRQRVALGRALLARPAVLMLDDSLSAVDVETEQNIIASLRALGAGADRPTIIMVSHRLSVLRGADNIVGIDKGAIVERGTHEELLASSGLYATLWGEQARVAALQARLASSSAESAATDGSATAGVTP